MFSTTKQKRVKGRKKRIRAKIKGTKERPRLCVFRSAKHIYAQLVDDKEGKVVASSNDMEIKGENKKTEAAKEVGKLIAKKAQKKEIKKVVFDRGPYAYHGRVKALAEGAREVGLKF